MEGFYVLTFTLVSAALTLKRISLDYEIKAVGWIFDVNVCKDIYKKLVWIIKSILYFLLKNWSIKSARLLWQCSLFLMTIFFLNMLLSYHTANFRSLTRRQCQSTHVNCFVLLFNFVLKARGSYDTKMMV